MPVSLQARDDKDKTRSRIAVLANAFPPVDSVSRKIVEQPLAICRKRGQQALHKSAQVHTRPAGFRDQMQSASDIATLLLRFGPGKAVHPRAFGAPPGGPAADPAEC